MHETFKHARSKPLERKHVDVTGGFWKPILDRSRQEGLPRLFTQYENRNIVGNFRDAAEGKPRAEDKNAGNYDEFLFKALEAGACCLAHPGTEKLKEQYRRIRDIVIAAQEPDGYLNTYSIQKKIEHFAPQCPQIFYAGGHLMQAGIAELTTTGETTLFDAAKRYMDRIVKAFTEEGREMPGSKWPDHPNVEMALVELYRVTGDQTYLAFCDKVLRRSEYRERTQMLNHAVCEMLHCTGGADYYLETGDEQVWAATRRLWQDLLKKIYVTGAVGSTNTGATRESVGKEHYLTNVYAYAETCAALSLVFWSWRMFLATAEPEYADMMERVLYNGVLCGMALNGYEYFYQNPHEYKAVTAEGSSAPTDDRADARGENCIRKEVHGCSCCPPNVQRLLASLQQYIYASKDDTVWVNLFVGSRARFDLPGGTVTLDQTTDYPWDGKSEIRVEANAATDFALRIRIPGWCRDAGVAVNGKPVGFDGAGGQYVQIRRAWRPGDTVTVALPMPARLVESHPKNIASYGKVVIVRGPIVYCLEGVDNPDIDLFDVVVPAGADFSATYEKDLLDGVVVLEGDAFVRDSSEWDGQPYRDLDPTRKPKLGPARIRAIPYYAWANRGRNDMVTALPFTRG